MLTTDDMKRLLQKTDTYEVTDADSTLSTELAKGDSDILGKKIISAEDLETVRRVGEEDNQEQVDSTLAEETLSTARRVGGEVEGAVGSGVDADCKKNPEEDTTIEHSYRDDTNKEMISKGIEEMDGNLIERRED